MTLRRTVAAAIAGITAIAAAGCGLGEGESSEGVAELIVTRDYGSVPMLEATVEDPPASETVIRLLDRKAEITTRFGGGFVHSIEGIAGEISAGRTRDWFFFVNGVESETGAAEVGVEAGDRIWWDYRDWTDSMRAPAVVGSWPQPFSGSDRAVEVECEGARAPCEAVVDRLSAEGVEARLTEAGDGETDAGPRFVVGPWPALAGDPVAEVLTEEPATSGVFARFEPAAGGARLVVLDERAEPVRRLGRAGLVAALRDGDEPPVWLVTGTDATGVEAAAAVLREETLADRYALATDGSASIPLPAR
jgi:hypothetical protein